MAEVRVGIIGFGKIAKDQHVPSMNANPRFRFAAAVAPRGPFDIGVPVFTDVATMLREAEIDAVAICTPPGPRYAIAHQCLSSGVHVLLEKPPCATVGEISALGALAARMGRVLFTAWHSQFNDTVVRAAEITHAEGIAALDIRWLEDVEKWHPGQEWIWQKGGFGVFDPGINALSITTTLCPEPLLIRSAQLVMHEAGNQPIAAKLGMATGGVDTGITARFDWRHKGDEEWTISVTTGRGTRLALSSGGAVLRIDGGAEERSEGGEYPGMYRRFAQLIDGKQSLVDVEPLRAVADALLVAERCTDI